MDFSELVKNRFSVRKFDGTTLSSDEIGVILEAGRAAPTAKNQQPQRIFVLKTKDALANLKKCTACDYDTKTAFLICYDTDISWKRPFDGADSGQTDASIIATHMMLSAFSIGVGTTWVMWFDPEKVRYNFDLPDNLVPAVILVAGHAAPDAKPSENHQKRKPLDETVEILQFFVFYPIFYELFVKLQFIS